MLTMQDTNPLIFPLQKMKKAIADILVREGYVKSAEVIDDGIQGVIRVTLKYAENKQRY